MTCDDSTAVAPADPDLVDEDVEELPAGQGVEAGERLVEDEDRRTGAQGGEHDLRLLAAGRVELLAERDVELVEAAPGQRRIEPARRLPARST